MHTLSLQILGIDVNLHCCSRSYKLLDANFGALKNTASTVTGKSSSNLQYRIESQDSDRFSISQSSKERAENVDIYDLIYFLEKDITVELQKIRKDLLFIHGAALSLDNKACLIVAPSGSGKSTTTWALLHHGFTYLSDELSPIDVPVMKVYGYPHALCLKADPPAGYPLPPAVIRTRATLHIPLNQSSIQYSQGPAVLTTLFFLEYRPQLAHPEIHEISPAEASARIYANALNPLAHPEGGLDTVIDVAKKCKNYNIVSADLKKTAELVWAVMSQ